MKRIVLAAIAISMFGATFAQKNPLTRGKTLGIHFGLQDFSSGRALDTATFGDILDRKEWYKPSRLSPVFTVSYAKGLMPKIDLRANLSGSFEDYLFKNRTPFGINDFLGELDVTVNVKAVNDKHWVIPYITAGIGASYYKGYMGAIAPVGLGLQVNLFNDAYIDLQSQMRLGITDNTTNHFVHSLGVVANINSPKKKVK